MNVLRKNRLSLQGILLLDKPVGYSSNQALLKVKSILNAQKAGHTGTLDPFASGVLPLCFGEATKFAQALLDANKTYEALVYLGIRTTTGDTEGEVIARCGVDLRKEQIEQVLLQFRGPIQQIPPMYSALKRDGKPLYAYARAGVTVERQARHVLIHALQLLDYQAPFLRLQVTCSKGTYIRVLAEDIGAALGCGAHLQALRRTQVGSLTVDNCISMDAFMALDSMQRGALLAPVDSLLSGLPAVLLARPLAKRFLQGQRLTLAKEGMLMTIEPGCVRVYLEPDNNQAPQLLGIAQFHEYGVLAPERLIASPALVI